LEAHGLRRRKVEVVLDTNMLLVPYQFGVDIIEEIHRILPEAEVYTIPQVVEELEKLLSSKKQEERLGARIAQQVLERVKVLEEVPELPTDTALVELSKEGFIVATNDRELKKRIWKNGGRVIYLRERNHLELG
jgi:rRNA-processing protein FCF1